jgi:GxxExxY protein
MNTDKGKSERDPQTFEIIGAAMEVNRQLGPGFLEAVYQEALAIELTLRDVPFAREVALPVAYKGTLLSCGYRADFVCFSEVIAEIKALENLTGTHTAQVINYLRATGLNRALLLNFGGHRLEYSRIVL